MLIIGCDYHPGFQQIAFVDTETGEGGERRLVHREEPEQFYGELKQRRCAVRVGMEGSGHSRWFERLLRDLEFELWICPAWDRSGAILSPKVSSGDSACRRGSIHSQEFQPR